jgi:predicted ferric reductase
LFGFDRLNQAHRLIGYSILSLLVAHPILLIVGNSISNNVSMYSQLGDYLANKSNILLAFFALGIFIYIVFLSIIIVKKKLRYETWYITHLLTYLAIGLALAHQFGTGDLRDGQPLYYWYVLNYAVFGFVLIYRFLRPLALFFRHRFVIQNVVKESDNVCSIYVVGRNMHKFEFKSGQYANINILARGMRYSHPFSFSDAYNGRYARFSIKNCGDFTSKISQIQPGTKLVIDGPLGMFVDEIAERDKFLLIAGGIGITPLLAMLKSLAWKHKDVALLYGARTDKDLVFKREIEDVVRQYENISVHYILSEETAEYEYGYIDSDKITRLVPDYQSREIFLCGPPLMMESVNNNLKSIGFSQEYIHYEKFSF